MTKETEEKMRQRLEVEVGEYEELISRIRGAFEKHEVDLAEIGDEELPMVIDELLEHVATDIEKMGALNALLQSLQVLLG